MKKLFTILYLFTAYCCFSQNNTVAYTRDYVFNEGIFLTLDQFLSNKPIPKQSIIFNLPASASQLDFLKELVKHKTIVYMDDFGNKQQIETDSIWGYSQNKFIHINYNKQFARLNVIGTLCQFAATITTTIMNTNPMYPGLSMNSTVEELHQFIYDTQHNSVVDFTPKAVAELLKNDEQLFNEYMGLKRRKRADSIFIYVRKYNEKHPLYLPLK